jgi:ABC-type sugar transport system ATPase subunit
LKRTAVKIPNLANTIRNMSGGQRQCVAIARTATFASKLIIMDEPTAALGVQETAQVENIIRQLKANGEPLVLISHNMRQVFELADRIETLQVEALCWCGRKGTHNARTKNGEMVTEGEQVVVGDTGVDADVVGYEVLCRRHHMQGMTLNHPYAE